MSLHLQKLIFTISTLKHLHDDVLEEKFSDKHIPSVTAIEKPLINAANGRDFDDTMEELKKSCYKDDVEMPTLTRHFRLLQNVVKQGNPEVKKLLPSMM